MPGSSPDPPHTDLDFCGCGGSKSRQSSTLIGQTDGIVRVTIILILDSTLCSGAVANGIVSVTAPRASCKILFILSTDLPQQVSTQPQFLLSGSNLESPQPLPGMNGGSETCFTVEGGNCEEQTGIEER